MEKVFFCLVQINHFFMEKSRFLSRRNIHKLSKVSDIRGFFFLRKLKIMSLDTVDVISCLAN